MGIGLAKKEFEQPSSFEFTKENFAAAEKIIAKYPKGRQQSAVIPLLTLAQQQHEGWLPKAAMDYVASILSMPPIKVYEVATFYTMYNLQPIGKYHVQVCTTTPCWLRGSDEILHACEARLGIKVGGTTPDGKFTLSEVECLGACVNAPMIEVTSGATDGYYEDLTPFAVHEIIDRLSKDDMPEFGPVSGRSASEPVTGALTLTKGKKQKPKMKAKITGMEDTGLPSVELDIKPGGDS
jgi:NADH-quinone oxidoreductase E subunit